MTDESPQRLWTHILVVNADGFGTSAGVNAGVIAAHERGIVTSTSLTVRGHAAEAAAEYASAGSLSVGLHVDFEMDVVDLNDRGAVTRELRAQVDRFQELVGRPPSHLDSRRHEHRAEPVRSAFTNFGWTLKVPVRHFGIPYHGGFHGHTDTGEPNHDAIGVDAIVALIDGLAAPVTEMRCHPAAALDFDSPYAAERLVELETLCDARVRERLEHNGVLLLGFGDLPQFLS